MSFDRIRYKDQRDSIHLLLSLGNVCGNLVFCFALLLVGRGGESVLASVEGASR